MPLAFTSRCHWFRLQLSSSGCCHRGQYDAGHPTLQHCKAHVEYSQDCITSSTTRVMARLCRAE
eukprot:6199925-Pleurochrysis_carterae.AAC.2